MISTWKGLMAEGWLLLLLCATVWAHFDSCLDKSWDLWKITHHKKYKNELEELGRRTMWERKVKEINTHNMEAALGLHTYTMALNHLSDLTKDELDEVFPPMELPEDFTFTPLNVTVSPLPASVDWRQHGYVTSVKDQGQCLSCYAFSSVGALEGLMAKTTGQLVDLSPQNLVDCSKQFGNNGCNRGRMDHSFQYVISNKGIDSEASYHYQGVDGPCRYSPSHKAATCSSYHFVPQNEFSLQQAVANIGPISVGINQRDIVGYHRGVYNNPHCGKTLDHAVLVVGYGTDPVSGLDYWLIKNSYGPGWGENGYLRLARNKNQMCGISLHSVYPL